MSDDDIGELGALTSPPAPLPRGHMLASEGERPHSLHIVHEGWAARVKILPDGRRHICGLLLPGDLCDVDGLHVQAFDYSVVTLTRCRVATIDRQKLVALQDRRPAVMHAFAWLGFVDNSLLNEAAVSLALRQAPQRAAHLLCELGARLAAVGRAHPDGFDLPLTQEQLGEILGLTAVHTNRTLRVLREIGVARIERGRVIVPSWKALRDEARFSPAYLHLEGLCRRREPYAIGRAAGARFGHP